MLKCRFPKVFYLIIEVHCFKRWVQVTSGVTLKSYTFFKPLDLNRSNGQKKTLINTIILISISLIILYLLHSIPISKPKKNTKKYTYLSNFFSHHFSQKKKKKKKSSTARLSVSFSSITLPTPPSGCRQKKRKKEENKKKKPLVAQLVSLPLFFPCYNFLDRTILLYLTIL